MSTEKAHPDDTKREEKEQEEEQALPNMTLLDITEPADEGSSSSIPIAKFVDDLDSFVNSFSPPAPAELLIGAYTELHAKYKTVEATLANKQRTLSEKVPELEKSLGLVQNLQQKKEEDSGRPIVTRYSLADNIYAKAELDESAHVVYLWLGANVMLEYQYPEAIDFLTSNVESARTELAQVQSDLGLVREQIVTSEVSMSRIYNWDVRRKRTGEAAGTTTRTGASSASGSGGDAGTSPAS